MGADAVDAAVAAFRASDNADVMTNQLRCADTSPIGQRCTPVSSSTAGTRPSQSARLVEPSHSEMSPAYPPVATVKT